MFIKWERLVQKFTIKLFVSFAQPSINSGQTSGSILLPHVPRHSCALHSFTKHGSPAADCYLLLEIG